MTPEIVKPTKVEPIENADTLDVATVWDYQCIVKRGTITVESNCLYIPEGYVVSDEILTHVGLNGRLAGPKRNRVKAIKLRGVLSQGLLFALEQLPTSIEGALLAGDWESAGIVKYEAPIPATMMGKVTGGHTYTKKYDFDNIKRHPKVFDAYDRVVVTEKIHGTNIQLGITYKFSDIPEGAKLFGPANNIWVTSKGLGARNIVLENTPENADNLYIKTAKAYQFEDGLKSVMSWLDWNNFDSDHPTLVLFGEVFGDVQDLKYGHSAGQRSLIIFDAMLNGKYVPWNNEEFWNTLSGNFPIAMPLVEGYASEVIPTLPTLAALPSRYGGGLREGVVVKCANEIPALKGGGRRIYKVINPAYLLREGGEELQ